jgi:hypothetical protein
VAAWQIRRQEPGRGEPDRAQFGATDGPVAHDAQQSLDVGVGDRKPAIVEEGAQGRLLPGPVVDALAEQGLLVDLGRDDHAFELAPQRDRLGLSQRASPGGVEVALGRGPLDVVQGVVQIDHRLRAAVALLEGLHEPAPSVVVASDAPGRVGSDEQRVNGGVAVVLDVEDRPSARQECPVMAVVTFGLGAVTIGRGSTFGGAR